jgi:hypothetical protein
MIGAPHHPIILGVDQQLKSAWSATPEDRPVAAARSKSGSILRPPHVVAVSGPLAREVGPHWGHNWRGTLGIRGKPRDAEQQLSGTFSSRRRS